MPEDDSRLHGDDEDVPEYEGCETCQRIGHECFDCWRRDNP